jgi:hypothetical protein
MLNPVQLIFNTTDSSYYGDIYNTVQHKQKIKYIFTISRQNGFKKRAIKQ